VCKFFIKFTIQQLRKTTTSKAARPSLGSDLAPLNIIRNETVLSRLPIHRLSKQGSVDIKHREKGCEGRGWQSSGKLKQKNKHGEPAKAYKLDTLVVNRRIDELGRPLPEDIRLGSLRDIGNELGFRQQYQQGDPSSPPEFRATIVRSCDY